MSKGSGRRPQSVDNKTFTDNWDNIFNKKEIPLEEKPQLDPEPERYYEWMLWKLRQIKDKGEDT